MITEDKKPYVNRLVEILMQRDGMPYIDALEILQEARQELNEGGNPEDILEDYFGLDNSYVGDIFGIS